MSKKKIINHVAIVLDDSGSMVGLRNKVVTMFDEQVASLKRASAANKQDTRLSVYTFGSHTSRVLFEVPLGEAGSIAASYRANQGSTALIQAMHSVITDFESINTRYGDHSFLIYVLTDGGENVDPTGGPYLRDRIEKLNDDWTLAVLVPNSYCQMEAVKFGFSKGNAQIWETTEQGLSDVSAKVNETHGTYMSFRSAGIKSTKTLFTLPAQLTKTEVRRKLEPIPAKDYNTIPVRKYDEGKEIKEFVEKMTGEAYRVGSAYYQLTKPEKIQPSKTIAVVDKQTGQMFSGPTARSLLSLPAYEVKVAPADYAHLDVFVQSHSTNRHLVANTHLVVFK